MSTQPLRRMSPTEYLAFERASRDVRHEYYQGEIFAMSGASRNHNRVTINLTGLTWTALQNSGCELFANDMRVKVDRSGLYTYPDVVITCQSPRFEDEHLDTLVNPQVVIEVLSDSTESYDRGAKFKQYRQIPSLREYVLVSQKEPLIERFFLNENGQWSLDDVAGLEAELLLKSAPVTLKLADVYDRVEFPPPEAPPPEARMSFGRRPASPDDF